MEKAVGAVDLTYEDLPEEVRGRILNYIPQREVLQVRLVCKAWNKDVDEQYDHEVSGLNERSIHFGLQLRKRVKDLRIECLIRPVVHADGTLIFSFPNVVTRLTIGGRQEDYLRTSISAQNLEALLGALSANLEFLWIRVCAAVYNHEYSAELGFNFAKLTNLKIEVYEFYNFAKGGPSLIGVLERSRYGTLKSLEADVHIDSRVGKSRTLGSLLRLVGSNGSRLEKLCLRGPKQYGSFVRRSLGLEGELSWESVTGLREFEGKLEYLGLGLKVFLEGVIRRQTGLKKLSVDYVDESNVDLNLWRSMPNVNGGGLEWINLKNVSQRIHPGLDLSVFEGFGALKGFGLFGEGWVDQTWSTSVENLTRLPSTLTQLKLVDIKLIPDEVLRAMEVVSIDNDDGCRLRRFPHLETLWIVNTGWETLERFTFDTAKNIMMSSTLVDVKLRVISSTARLPFFDEVLDSLGYNNVTREEFDGIKLVLQRQDMRGKWELIRYKQSLD